MIFGLTQRLRRARPFTVTDPNGGWRCRVFMTQGDRDGTVDFTAYTPIPFERIAHPSIRVTAAGAEAVGDHAGSARDWRLSIALAETLTDPAQARHLAAAARRIERSERRRNRWHPHNTACMVEARRHVHQETRTATVLLAALAAPPQVRAVTLRMLAADPAADPAEVLTAARVAGS